MVVFFKACELRCGLCSKRIPHAFFFNVGGIVAFVVFVFLGAL